MKDSTPRYVDAHELKAWIHDEAELALLDVREHGQFGENHLFFAVPLPYSELELHIARLVPRAGTRTVIYGDAETGPAVQAAARALARLGYRQVHVLRGGIQAWRDAGYATFAGVNLPSKTFGEIAEHIYHTPS
ncbi:MAG TPA: rhodanese-like domain-containing protein, partial [Bordetella sp.]|nr:rhodanese-like domain-containing protein [Bordetella sp.]